MQGTFLDTATLAGTPYLTVMITGLAPADIWSIGELIDGDTLSTHDDAGGRIRGSENGTAADTLYYLALPVN